MGVNWRLLHQHHVSPARLTATRDTYITVTMSLPVIQENEEEDGPENDLLTQSSTIHHKTRRETAFSLEGALISSHSFYVARIGVINNAGWLLTLAKPCRQNKYQQRGSWAESCASDDNTNHDYEEIKDRKNSAGHRYRYSYTQSKTITGSLLQTNNNFHPVSHEGHYPYYRYEDVPLPPGHQSHPLHSLTHSDIE